MVLLFLYKSKSKDLGQGFLFGLFLVLVFTFRFFVEFLKENQSNFEAGMILNMGQLLSIPFVLIGIVFIIRAFRKKTEEQQVMSKPGKQLVK